MRKDYIRIYDTAGGFVETETLTLDEFVEAMTVHRSYVPTATIMVVDRRLGVRKVLLTRYILRAEEYED